MGLFDRLERSALRAADLGTYDINDPRLWSAGALTWDTFAGFPISAETATRVSTVFACVSLKGETLGSLPCHLYRRLENGGRDLPRPLFRDDHRVVEVGHLRPVDSHGPLEGSSSEDSSAGNAHLKPNDRPANGWSCLGCDLAVEWLGWRSPRLLDYRCARPRTLVVRNLLSCLGREADAVSSRLPVRECDRKCWTGAVGLKRHAFVRRRCMYSSPTMMAAMARTTVVICFPLCVCG